VLKTEDRSRGLMARILQEEVTSSEDTKRAAKRNRKK
jgi:hypothetical protein